MKKPLKLALIIGGSILVAVIAVFAILKGFEPTVGSKYYAIFYYQTGGYGNEASQHRAICIECTPGDTITFPEPEGIQQGYEFEGYRLSKMNAYGEEVFMPGDTLQTSSEMFEIFDAVSPGGSLWLANDCVINNDTDSICNIYAICYDGSFLLGDYTVTLHNFEMVESEPIEYNLHSAKEVYQTVAYRLCSRYREGAVIQDIYVDGYKLEGLYLDEGFTIPYTSTSANGTDLDIYAKWVYAGLFFTNEMGEMTLSKIDLNEDVTTLTIPCTVNFLDVTEMKATVLSECEAKIGKLILPRTLKNIPRATFSGDTVSEVEVGDNTIIEKGAFTNTTITLNPTNTKYVVEDGVL
ncbi:MAG: hypothetical protein J6R42_02405, partial [Clostridia bacterium]|nr:hypothetical protein [Clostridia bacterium]